MKNEGSINKYLSPIDMPVKRAYHFPASRTPTPRMARAAPAEPKGEYQMSQDIFKVTKRSRFFHGTTQIVVEEENTNTTFRWRMSVNGNMSRPTKYYEGVLVHKGFGLATEYWEGVLPAWTPFKIDEAHLDVVEVLS